MSEQSRKVKNPLLTAAGQGFPFEGYSTNALLMPITPAAPAILQDAVVSEESEDPKVPESGIPSEQRAQPEFPVGQERSTTDERLDGAYGESSHQPAGGQSYFGSILSSLPNLSLSSITGEGNTSRPFDSQEASVAGPPPQPGAPRDSAGHGFSRNPYGAPSGTLLADNPSRDQSGLFSRAFGDSAISEAALPNLESPRPPPAGPALPLAGAGSYRLGNQRRLKYAPPPDLTSNTPKQYPLPKSFLSPAQPTSASSDFFVPSPVGPASLYGSQSSPSFPSSTNLAPGFGASHISGSYGSLGSTSGPATHLGSNLATGVVESPGSSLSQSRASASLEASPSLDWSGSKESWISSAREIPSRVPKPATPRNTPVNASFVSSYSANQPESWLSPVPSNLSGGSRGFEVSTSARSNLSPTHGSITDKGAIIEPNDALTTTGETQAGLNEDSSFTAISAARVTAKLEDFIAERQEASHSVPRFHQEVSRVADSKLVVESEKIEDSADIDSTRKESLADASSNQARIVVGGSGVTREPGFPGVSRVRDIPRAEESHFFPSAVDGSSSITSNIVSDTIVQTSVPSTLPPSGSNFFNTSIDRATPGSGILFPAAVGSYSDEAATNSRQNSETGEPPRVPTFYNPSEFPIETRDSRFPRFGPHFPMDARISGQSPSSSVLSSSPPSFPSGDSFVESTMPEPTGSATLNPVQMSLGSPGIARTDTVPPSLQSLAGGPADRRMQYRPVYHHWFYRKEVETKILWLPFSMQDSLSLEEVHNSTEITPETIVATDGGRYDVEILRRRRTPVYWSGVSTEVRRSSWFCKGSSESRYVPYEESVSARLEEEYKQACLTDNWNRRVELNNGEYIVFHGSTVQVHHVPATSPEITTSWANSADSETGAYLQGAASRPRVVKRGVDEFNIDEGEPEKVDHLLFLVHGVGSACDLRFRSVEEVVDEFRCISLQLVQSHYRTASMHGIVNRIEVLPVSWHTTLHSEDTGIDKKLRAITLESIPKLRHFTNDTLLDILFYTSPIYCQTIMQTVGNEMNRLYALFKERNPNFGGSVYLGGHSLGSLILFDLLCHQKPPDVDESRDETDPTPTNSDGRVEDEATDSLQPMRAPVLKRRLSKRVSYVMGAAGTGQPFINYPQLSFLPQAFFALGSPIGMFVTVRGIDTLGEDFALPTCPAFFNVFHPFDPVAYRVESLINPEAQKYRPMLIPHHKGRKRMHLELKETMARVGADLKQKLLDSVRSTWNSVYQLAMFHRPENRSFEQEIEKVVEEQLQNSPSVHEHQSNNEDDGGADFRVGRLNGGRRIDYVLQEAPFEYINEYIFALTSHVCYWESEDTMLMILKEIYGGNGIHSDAKLPPQTMTIERVSLSPSIATTSGVSTSYQNRNSEATSPVVGFDPTAPIANKPLGPPPISGFVRKL